MSELISKTLWSDDKTLDEVIDYDPKHFSNAAYNMFEDIQCLKERIAELERKRDEFKATVGFYKQATETIEHWSRNFGIESEETSGYGDIRFGILFCSRILEDIYLGENLLAKRDLAQQAKGIEDAIHNSPSRLEYAIPLVSTLELYSYAQQLRKQAGEL